MSVMTADPFEREQARDAALWTGAAFVVAAIHVGLAVAYLVLTPQPVGRAEAPVIDVAFMPATNKPAPAAPPAQPFEPAPPVDRANVEPPREAPAASPEAVPKPEPPPAPLVLTTPEIPAEPQMTVAPPKPAAVAPKPDAPVVVPERAPRERVHEQKADTAKRHPPPPKTAASPGSQPARLALAPNPGVEGEGARTGRASWLSEFIAHMRRFNTYSANGSKESGTVRVSVTIDRNGRVLSRHVVGSSGSSTLDSAALNIIERAQPFPRFPAGMSQAQVVEVVPLHLRPQ